MSRPVLEQECQVFTRYLTGQAATPYVVKTYCHAHSSGLSLEGDQFDERLTAAASRSPQAAFVADAYARFFTPRGLLRKKLVLLLSIVETAPPFFRDFDSPMPGGLVSQALRLAGRFVLFAFALAAGIVVFHPMRIASGARRTPPMSEALQMKEESVPGRSGSER